MRRLASLPHVKLTRSCLTSTNLDLITPINYHSPWSYSAINRVKHSTTRRTKHSMRNDATKNAEEAKYCAVCGRLISSHVRNFEERKYCSKSCKGTKLNEVDEQIEREFIAQAIEHGSVECGKIQRLIGERLGLGGNLKAAQSEQEKSAAGNAEASFRERVRRAARRVVVNGERDGHSFVCWSHGKAAEPSFAKGEWSVRHVKK